MKNHKTNRRRFLQLISLAGLYGVSEVSMAGNDSTENEWEFLEKRTAVKLRDINKIKDRCTPFGPNSPMKNISPKTMGDVRTKIREFIQQGRLPASKGFRLTPRMQYFAMPDEERYVISTKRHCEQATDLLYQKISGLDNHKIKWTGVSKKGDFTNDYNERAFIGRNYHIILAVQVRTEDFSHVEEIYFPGSNQGATARTKHRQGQLDDWHLFVSTNESALFAPFSEVIPLTTGTRRKEYERHVGPAKAMIADETLAEGISHVLATEMMSKIQRSKKESILERRVQAFSRNQRYSFVSDSIRWIQRNGVQAAFDLYMENPGKYVHAIRS